MSKSCAEQLRDIAREYADAYSKEYEIDALVSWAIDAGRFELSREDVFKQAKRRFTDALREACDDDGVRVFINARLQQRQLWAHRTDASWQLRQTFLDEQAKRVVDMRDAVVRQCAKFNAERKKGEPEFQATFDWDSDETQTA